MHVILPSHWLCTRRRYLNMHLVCRAGFCTNVFRQFGKSDRLCVMLKETYADFRELLSLYRAEFCPTVKAWWGRICALSTTLGIIIAAILYYTKPRETAMKEMLAPLWWQIPLMGGACFLVVSLFLVPYRKYKERDRDAVGKEKQRRVDIEALNEAHRKELEEAAQQNTYFYREVLPEETNKLKAQLTALIAERDLLRAEFDKPRLKFEVNTALSTSEVLVRHNRERFAPPGIEPDQYDQYEVTANLHILFDNEDADQIVARSMKAALMRINRGRGGREKEIPHQVEMRSFFFHEDARRLNNGKGLVIPARTRTEYKEFYFRFDTPTPYGKRLNENCFIRVTLEAMGQPPYCADIFPNWEDARKHGRIYLNPTLQPKTRIQYRVLG